MFSSNINRQNTFLYFLKRGCHKSIRNTLEFVLGYLERSNKLRLKINNKSMLLCEIKNNTE